jgi:YHS domain-containing protein
MMRRFASLISRRALLGLGLVAAVVVVAVATLTVRGDPPPPNISGSDNLAIKGYDAVAYFTEGRAVEGKSEFRHSWEGASWQFSSASNRDVFAASPDRYAPQYGGFCSLGVAKGVVVTADPEAWTIVDGKLYMQYSLEARERWRENPQAYIALSEDNWSKNRP